MTSTDETLDYTAIKAEHAGHMDGNSGCTEVMHPQKVHPRCLPYRLAVNAERWQQNALLRQSQWVEATQDAERLAGKVARVETWLSQQEIAADAWAARGEPLAANRLRLFGTEPVRDALADQPEQD